MKANSKRPRKKSSARPRKGKTCPRYPHERKLQAVKLPLEEEYSLNILSEELGPCKDTIAKWVQYYLMGGGEALKPVECPLVPQTATSALKNTCHGAYREENLVAHYRSPNIACATGAPTHRGATGTPTNRGPQRVRRSLGED